MNTTPVISAMLICDKIIAEAMTNKKTLVGIFENIAAVKFPCIHHSLSIYINFTDALGSYDFKLELVDSDENKPLNTAEIKNVVVKDKLMSSELAFNLQGLSFPHPGKYEFRIYANDKFCGSKFFNVVQLEQSQQRGEVV